MSRIRSRGLLTAFAMVFVTLLVTTALGYLNVRRLYQHDQLVEHTHEVMSELRLLLGSVADAEAGVRGYVITSNTAYLKPYEAALVTTPDSLSHIQRLTADNPRQLRSMQELKTELGRCMDVMQEVVAATREQGAQAASAMVARGKGRAATEAVRDVIRDMEREEARLLAARRGDATAGYWTAIVSSLTTAVIGLALATLGLLWTNRDLKAREQRAIELRELNERLEERVRERTSELTAANVALQEEIGERHRAEKTVRQFAAELERSNRELAQFAAVASHDLQEPLRKIQAFADRLHSQCHDQLSEKGREFLDRMVHAALRMRALIDGLLAYSRVSSGKQARTPVELTKVAREVVSDLEASLQQSGGEVTVEELPTIAADALQMRQLLQNLIGNALKFQRKDTAPQIRVSGRIIHNGEGSDGDLPPTSFCELAVADNGIGFEPAYAQQIFGLFQRLHGRDEYEGTGMGLAICKKIVERHGGQITADSRPGQGSTFLVTLPLTPRED